MHFVLIHCRLYERILQFSFLYTSLNAKFTLAARARATEHGASYALLPEQCSCCTTGCASDTFQALLLQQCT